ncbi:Pyrroline-5-carboxylate reductase [Dirofilaria immitis]|nr:Pyrroline-5-carboxylate reductase [Dirofilaria immitis]
MVEEWNSWCRKLRCEGKDSESVENGSTNLRKLFENTDLEPKLTFIGGGKMATALICGFESAGLITKDDVAVSVKTKSSAQRWKKLGYENVYTSNDAMIRAHGQGMHYTICLDCFLSIKPQMRTAMLEELSNEAFANTPLIISIMGGVDVKTLEIEIAARGYISKRGLVRLMPNLPVTVCSGASIMCFSPYLQQKKIDLIQCIMQHVGICLVISEKSFDAATAVAGCGPAFMFMAIEALSDGGVLGGIDRTTSMKLAAQTVMSVYILMFKNVRYRAYILHLYYVQRQLVKRKIEHRSSKMVLEASEHPAALKDDVCSAGGSTIYGVKELEKTNLAIPEICLVVSVQCVLGTGLLDQ